MSNKTLLLKCEQKVFTDKDSKEQRPYFVFSVEVAGMTIPLVPKDNTAKQILVAYYKDDIK